MWMNIFQGVFFNIPIPWLYEPQIVATHVMKHINLALTLIHLRACVDWLSRFSTDKFEYKNLILFFYHVKHNKSSFIVSKESKRNWRANAFELEIFKSFMTVSVYSNMRQRLNRYVRFLFDLLEKIIVTVKRSPWNNTFKNDDSNV